MNIQISFFEEHFIKAIGAGVYEVSVEHNGRSAVLYIGESKTVLGRCATHLYKLKKNPAYFGFTPETINDPSVTLRFRFLEAESDDITRGGREKQLITASAPLCQSGSSDSMKSIDEKINAVTAFLQL